MSMDETLNLTRYSGDRTDLVAIWDHLQAVIDARITPERERKAAREALRRLR